MKSRKMFGIFRESSPPIQDIPVPLYTMEIFHGGYVDKQLDDTKKYKMGMRRMYIPGGGRRKYHEALADFHKPDDSDWEDLLNSQTARDKERVVFEANLMASQLYSSKEGMPRRFETFHVVKDVVPLQEILGPAIDLDDVVDLDGDGDDVHGDGEEVYGAAEELNEHVKDVNMDGEEVNGPRLSQGTFAGLSDIVSDLHMDEETTFKQSSEKVAEKRGTMMKHCVRRPCPPGFNDDLARELEEIRQKERDEANKREREELDELARVETELRESQAKNGLNREEIETSAREAEEKKKQEERERERKQLEKRLKRVREKLLKRGHLRHLK
ncbi:hypothetical protein ACLB2K_029588 [Fragaria x ananassa]